MPSKSQRAASRQAQLRRRKPRGKGRTQEFAAGPVRAEPAPDAPAAEADSEPVQGPASTPAAVLQPEPGIGAPGAAARPARRPRVRTANDPAAVYRYLGPELRRIGLITTAIVAVLIGLTFVMGG